MDLSAFVCVCVCVCVHAHVCVFFLCPHKHELTFGLCFLGCSEGSGCSYSTPCVCVCLASQIFKAITCFIL